MMDIKILIFFKKVIANIIYLETRVFLKYQFKS